MSVEQSFTKETKEQAEKNRQKDLQDLEDLRRDKMYDSSLNYWKPQPGEGNIIRILPGVGGAHYHFKVAKHWMRKEDEWVIFVCPKITYGKPCACCEERDRLFKMGLKEESVKFKPNVKGIFNVIDRNNEAAGVRYWEAASTVCWKEIINMAKGDGPFNNIIQSDDDPIMGRDLNIKYDPDASPSLKYSLRPCDVTPLGTPEQVKKWVNEAIPLEVEVLYPEISYKATMIKTFGSPQEREILKREMAKAMETVEVVEKTKPSTDDTIKDIDAKVEAIRAKHEKPEEKVEKKNKVENKETDLEKQLATAKKLIEANKAKKANKAEPTVEEEIAILKEGLKIAKDDEEFDLILATINKLKNK